MDLMTQLPQAAPRTPTPRQAETSRKPADKGPEAVEAPFAGMLEQACAQDKEAAQTGDRSPQEKTPRPEQTRGEGESGGQARTPTAAAAGPADGSPAESTAKVAATVPVTPPAVALPQGALLAGEPAVAQMPVGQTPLSKPIVAQPIPAAAPAATPTADPVPEPGAEAAIRLQGLRSLEIQPTGGTYEAPQALKINLSAAGQPAAKIEDAAALTGKAPVPPAAPDAAPVTEALPASGIGSSLTDQVKPAAVPTPATATGMETDSPVTSDGPGKPSDRPVPDAAQRAETVSAAGSPATEAPAQASAAQESAAPQVQETAPQTQPEATAPAVAAVQVETQSAGKAEAPVTAPAESLEADPTLDDEGPGRTFEVGRTAGRAGRTDAQATSIRRQVLTQVAGSLEQTAGREKLTLRLNPEKLGQVEVMFEARNNRLEIIMTASGPEAEKALQEGAKDLADSLVDRQGRFQVVDIRVETRQQDGVRPQTNTDEKKDRQDRDSQRDGQQKKQNPDDGDARQWAREHRGG